MPSASRKPRRIRPSRARGLRASTGCLTCRKRRIKCDEKLPRCGQCTKSDRDCVQSTGGSSPRTLPRVAEGLEDAAAHLGSEPENNGPSGPTANRTEASNADGISPGGAEAVVQDPFPTENATSHPSVETASPASQTQSFLLSATPFQWYDLLAQDAISSIQRHNDGVNVSSRWEFDEASLSRRPSPEPPGTQDEFFRPSVVEGEDIVEGHLNEREAVRPPSRLHTSLEPSWNSATPSAITNDSLVYLQHYIQHIGPMLDLFDPLRNFSNFVPHLALRNTGLMKSILAVAARHTSLRKPVFPDRNAQETLDAENTPSELPDSARMARQYYYETLRYLSQALSYQSYADSHEILATAIMISTYEMLESTSPSDNGEWERHLRGGFWILRCQDNDGESVDGLRRAVWWAWLRQDMWAAFRAGRPTLTIWRPKKNLAQLTPDELATRIVYIAAKVVEYAGADPESAARDIQRRIEQGNKLRDALRGWKETLPASFHPIPLGSNICEDMGVNDTVSSAPTGEVGTPAVSNSATPIPVFQPIWIHPPSHAGALQTYHFAVIVLLLHMPTIGGPDAYRDRQQQLEESVNTVCGIATYEPQEIPLAFVNVQAVYAAGLCVQTTLKREALIHILRRTVDVLGFPTGDLVADLKRHWGEYSF